MKFAQDFCLPVVVVGRGGSCQAGHVCYLVHVSNSEKQEGNYVAPD